MVTPTSGENHVVFNSIQEEGGVDEDSNNIECNSTRLGIVAMKKLEVPAIVLSRRLQFTCVRCSKTTTPETKVPTDPQVKQNSGSQMGKSLDYVMPTIMDDNLVVS